MVGQKVEKCFSFSQYQLAVHSFDNGYVGKQPVAWEEYCAQYRLKELQESMDRCICHCDVNEAETIMVEIHNIDPKCKKLQDRYVQEVIELLRDTVCTRLGQINRKKEQPKIQKDSTGILTGTNVRVGYAFKNRPGNQTCLYSNSVMKHGKYNSEEDIDSLKVLPEKLIVYVQVLGSGSPKGMSQLRRRLSDVKHTSGSSVSISSYFQKMPSSQRSQVQETSAKGSTGENDTQSQCSEAELGAATLNLRNSDHVNSDKTPPSEGRKHKIKSILKRGNFPGKKKKKLKTVIETSNSMNSETKVSAGGKSDCMENNFAEDGEKNENIKCNIGSVTDSSKPIVSTLINEDDLPVNVSRVIDFNPSYSTFSVDTDWNESQTFTVSKVNAQNLADTSESSISCKTIGLKTGNHISCVDIHDNKESDNPSDLVTFSYPNPGIEVKSGDWITEQSGSQSGSSDNSPLPSASFCAVKSSKRLSQFNGDALRDILNVVESKQEQSLPDQGSPRFVGKQGKRKEYKSGKDKPPDSSKSDIGVSKKGNADKTLKRFRYKRKFPKFSDSDSEDSLPEKKRQSVLPEDTNKFTVTNSKKALCKKIRISKDFFSEDTSSKQPKLPFFTNNKQAKKDKENAFGSPPCRDEQFPDLDVELIQELSSFPSIKSEADRSLLLEVKSLSGVEYLNEEQIRFLIRQNETFLRQIFEGKVECNRHDAYKEGGKRRHLSFASRLGPYTDEQIDIVMECLMALFCKKHHKYLDYIMKVLLPEMLIQFHMEIHNTSHEESERLLGPRTPEQVSSS